MEKQTGVQIYNKIDYLIKQLKYWKKEKGLANLTTDIEWHERRIAECDKKAEELNHELEYWKNTYFIEIDK